MHREDVLTFRKQLKSLWYRARREEPVFEGLPSSAVQLLVAVARSAQPPKPSELAAELHVTDSNVAASLRLLESRHFINLARRTEDRRSSSVQITEQGSALVETVGQQYTEWLHSAINELFTEEEQQILSKAGHLMEVLAKSQSSL
ncbi:hypothetical protein GCM10009087_49970 [Sphingomonas oligophenolica]|uniref:MarR family transcriptional regulator n=1 Tax=Sphingomonas oligophenolica TaxID=301154 RepID=A0ABU9YBB4_9SPHN